MRRARFKSRALVLAERFCLCVVVFAAANWLMSVLHYRWTLRYDRLQVATWMGCLEIDWLEPGPMFARTETRAELTRGGVTGRSGLATVLLHVQWLPRVEQYNVYGETRATAAASRVAVPGGVVFLPTRTRATVPLWGLGVLSMLPYGVLALRARRRRRLRLCDRCDYSLVGLAADAEGRTLCPECGSRVLLSAPREAPR